MEYADSRCVYRSLFFSYQSLKRTDGSSEADKLQRLPPNEEQNIDSKDLDLQLKHYSLKRWEDLDTKDLERQNKRYENERYREDTESRKNRSLWAKWVVSIYLSGVILISLFNFACLHLSDPVRIALLGTPTLNVLGLMYIVLKGYFRVRP